jgi:hypothetical protein
MANLKHLTGGCLCGAVQFKLETPQSDVTACHCGQCRKVTGNFLATTNVPTSGLGFVTDSGLAWYRSSDLAERGFCKVCGSVLFWRQIESDHIAITAGSIDGQTGLTLKDHIFVDDKPDWYEISDDKPQYPAWR